MKDITIDFQKSDKWNTQLKMSVNFISSEDTDEEHVMFTKGYNMEKMACDEANEVIKELFESLLFKHKIGLKIPMILSFYNMSQIKSQTRSVIYWLPRLNKKKKSAINPSNQDNKCFQYDDTVALNYEQIKTNCKEYLN